MADRMIQCPECKGQQYEVDGNYFEFCNYCKHTGTILDRRRRTANDRAVERILAEDEAQGSGRYVDRYTQGYGDGVEHCAVIIREEAERHE